MSLDGGSVTLSVDPDGAPLLSGSGLAFAWARATLAALVPRLPALPNVGATLPPYRPERPATQADRDAAIAARRVLFEDKVRDALAVAPMLVDYLRTNAEVSLQGAAAAVAVSVGRAPNPNLAEAPILPPASPVSLPISGAGVLR